MSDKPEVKDLVSELHNLVSWQTFAIHLPGITQTDIVKIENDKQGTDQQKFTLYTKWLSVAPNGTWKDVIAALVKEGQLTLADQVKNNWWKSTSGAFAHDLQGVQLPLLTTGAQGGLQAQAENIEAFKKALMDIFDKNFAHLGLAIRNCMTQVAAEMFAAGLITTAVRDAPTSTSIVSEFKTLITSSRKLDEVINRCKAFIRCLASQGGPAEACATNIAEDWKAVTVKGKFKVYEDLM